LIIKNLKVEEGFFNSLNLTFTKGLNVLVGGRGVGKTSIIELLRYGLGAGNLSSINPNESSSHALSILQSSGRVSIELESGGRTITVSRSAMENNPTSTEAYIPPIIFSQKEIETIGLNVEGRINLIDSFIPDIQDKYVNLSKVYNELRSSSAHLTQLKKELVELRDRTTNLTTLKAREIQLTQQQGLFNKKNQVAMGNQKQLNDAQNYLATVTVDIQNLNSIKQNFEYRLNQYTSLLTQQPFPALNTREAINLNKFLIDTINRDNGMINGAINNTKTVITEIDNTLQLLGNRKMGLEESARNTRREVESFNEGAGAVLSELGRVKQDIAQLENFNKLALEKQQQINEIYEKCQKYLERTSELKNDIFTSRNQVVSQLNGNLLPTIGTYIVPQSNLSIYAKALEECFRGSGLKYKELISVIVEKVSPAWMLYYSFSSKYSDFAEAIGIPIDRATRLLGFLNEIDLAPILTAKIDDKVDFTLLDHGTNKHIEELSIGQRCTIALSIILENPNRVLIIDQPEDHLDNEFIASTLIKSIEQRAMKAQTILSSHNANIPVLGDASNVVNLESNGRKGFIKCLGAISDPNIKGAIESIMEGGKEAFQKRSEFYKS